MALIGCWTWVGSVVAQQQESRVALVIGNGAYKSSPLKNPVNDSKDVAAKLRSLGFTVVERNNLVVKQIGSTLREFRSTLKAGSVALVYYAGHGVQIKGENYLPAVDAEIGGEEDVPNQSLAMRQIMDVLGDAKTRLNLVFLDACRDNPYARSFRSSASGLSKENAPSGTLISFATRPGSVASDGSGRNGLYTGALLAAMNEPNRPIEQVLKSVVSTVKASSKNQQEPWMEGSIEGEFCFSGCKPLSVAQNTVSEMTDTQREDAFWTDVKGVGNREAFEAYLASYPTGRYAALAKASIVRLMPVGIPLSVQSSQSPPAQQAQSQSARLQTPNPGAVFKDCDYCPEMVVIPAGTFLMGTKRDPFSNDLPPPIDEQPQRSVSIRAFALGKYEVTQEQWYATLGTTPSSFKGRSLPVESISWEDAQAFVKALSSKTGKTYRLPSESEWEYSARAGSQTRFSFGDDVSKLELHGWYSKNASNAPETVGLKLPNQFGLYDMYGNIGEWVSDCYVGSYKDAPNDGGAVQNGSCAFQVARGGSWDVAARFIGSSTRFILAGTKVKNRYIGLRVVREL